MFSFRAPLATYEKQPRLRKFTKMEAMVMQCKGDTKMETGHSPVIVGWGFLRQLTKNGNHIAYSHSLRLVTGLLLDIFR